MSKTKEFLSALLSNDSVAAVGSISEALSDIARSELLNSQIAIAEKYGMKKVNEDDDKEYDSEDGDGDDKKDDEDKDLKDVKLKD